MSTVKFSVCLAAILGIGLAIRGWSSRLPDLPAEEYVRQGAELQRKERYSEAIRYYSAAIQKEPRNWQAITQRGICHVATREIEKSYADLATAIRYSHGKARDAYIQRSFLYRVGGYFDEALADANQVIALDQKDPLGYAIRSIVYEDPKRGDPAKAKADREKAFSLASPELRQQMLANTGAASR